MATVTREALEEVLAGIEASVEELTASGDEPTEASKILAEAATEIRTALEQDNEDQAARVVSGLRARIMGFEVLLNAGSDRGYGRKSGEKPQQSLVKTATAVHLINRLATDIGRHLQGPR